MKGDFFGYSVEALDGEVGHVSDFVVDDTNWKIPYLVVETSRLIAGKFILVSIDWVNNISWDDRKVFVDLTKEQVKQGDGFNPDEPISAEYEEKLYSSYAKYK